MSTNYMNLPLRLTTAANSFQEPILSSLTQYTDLSHFVLRIHEHSLDVQGRRPAPGSGVNLEHAEVAPTYGNHARNDAYAECIAAACPAMQFIAITTTEAPMACWTVTARVPGGPVILRPLDFAHGAALLREAELEFRVRRRYFDPLKRDHSGMRAAVDPPGGGVDSDDELLDTLDP